jgi:hypothetical protein
MSEARAPSIKTSNVRVGEIDRTGSYMEIGSVDVILDRVKVRVGIASSGVKWPYGVTHSMPKVMALDLEMAILDAWLADVRADWAFRRGCV